ncbi:MAG: HDOD domain-containing protein [Candidatus Wallbacteria bacterium]|nr:HDOD domain-containing protein [Candidatus Wallbacteria bacterium]
MDLEKLAGRIKDLPTLPVVINKIITLVENPKTSAADLAGVVSRDPALTAKILSVVNSAFYGFPRKIATISHAVMILGFGDIKNIALSVSVFDMFKKGRKNPGMNVEDFWKHSIGTGVCSRQLGKRVKYPEAEEAFIAGLLHDVGKIVFLQYLADEYHDVLSLAREEKIWIRDAEMRVLDGSDHCELGGLIAEKWKLPYRLVKVMKFHHEPTDSGDDIDMLTALVHAGDIFARARRIGDGGDGNFVPSLHKEVWYKLKIGASELNKIYEELEEEMKKTEEFLELAK